jgi:MFS family permease
LIGGLLVVLYLLAALLTPEDKPMPEMTPTTSAIPLKKIFSLNLSQHRLFIRLVVARFLFLLGIYTTGRFLLLFVANRLGLTENQAAEQAGNLLAGLALITVLASPLTGWLADRIGRVPLMIAGAIFSAVSALMLIGAHSTGQILLFGGLMSLGSAAFAGGSWAMLADVVPKDESARFFGLANFSTAGSAAAAGLFGPIIDAVDRISPGMGFSVLFVLAALAFLASIVPMKGSFLKKGREDYENKTRAHASGLVSLSLPADPAGIKKDQNS